MSPRLSLSTIQALQDAENQEHFRQKDNKQTIPHEKQSFPRFNFGIPLRFVCTDGTEHQGDLLNISKSTLALTTGALPALGSFITLHIDELCCCEGHVVRVFDTGFALKLRTERKRHGKPIVIDRKSGDLPNSKGKCSSFRKRSTKVRRPGGVVATCQLTDFSFEGLRLKMDSPPQYGDTVQIGLTKGHVSRAHGRNIEIEFCASPETRPAY